MLPVRTRITVRRETPTSRATRSRIDAPTSCLAMSGARLGPGVTGPRPRCVAKPPTSPGEGAQAEEVKIRTQSVDMEGARRSSDRFTQPESDVRSQREQQRQAKAQARKNQACQQLWKRILVVSGPFRFMDEYGKEVRVSESERKEREARLRKEYKERCRD